MMTPASERKPDPAPIVPDAPCAQTHQRIAATDLLLLIILLTTATFIHYERGPTRWIMHPEIMGLSRDPDASDPPSMDEVWNLALSTGRGSPYDTYPRDTLLRNVPAWTSMEGASPAWKVWTSLSTVTHPPLYLVTLRLWRSLFGGSDAVAIALSCFWSCVTVTFVYLAAGLALGRAAAFWSAAALVVSPVASYYAIDIRSYAMLTAEAAIAIWLLVRLTKYGPRTRDVIGLCTVLLACILTHYFSGAACLVAGLYAMVLAGRRWRFVLTCGVVTAVVYAIIWGPFLKQQLPVMLGPMAYLETAGAQVALKTTMAVTLPLRLLGEISGWPPLGIAEIWCVAALLLVFWAAIKRPDFRPFVVWFTSVALSLWLADVLRHTQQLGFIRYCAAAQPAVAVFAPAIAVVLLRRTWVVHVVGILVCGLALYIQPAAVHYDAPTFTSASVNIAPRMSRDDVLLIYREVAPHERDYVTDALVVEFSHVPGCFPRDAAILNHTMSPQMADELQGRQAWVLNLSEDVDIARIVPGATVVGETNFWPLINLPTPLPAYVVKFPASPPTTASH